MTEREQQEKNESPRRVVSTKLPNGRLVELSYDPDARTTALVVGDSNNWSMKSSVSFSSRKRLVPYSPDNNLIRNSVVLLPSAPEEYGSEQDLIADIQRHIHRYVDLSPRFERIATYYVLFTWLYDGFNEVPYLRVRGDYGTGKTRFLLAVGSLCYKPIYASGASTVAPLFHMIHNFRGTLILDEADFRFSDEKSDIVKILNNGNVRGVPVLRMRATPAKEFDVRSFEVFGPKILATRGYYDDRALESRFITEEMGGRALRRDVPINLPSSCREEALRLRNRLLLYRLRHFGERRQVDSSSMSGTEPRLRQIFLPLMSVISDPTVRSDIAALASEYQADITADRGMEPEALILEIVRELFTKERNSVSIGEITEVFKERCGADYKDHVNNRWIARIVRRKLNVRTHKSYGIYVIPFSEAPKLSHLYVRYGIGSREGQQGHEG